MSGIRRCSHDEVDHVVCLCHIDLESKCLLSVGATSCSSVSGPGLAEVPFPSDLLDECVTVDGH